ncbi:MAG: response regulator [Nitrospira sp.]|nr:response regulator [Nitrospira sp.]
MAILIVDDSPAQHQLLRSILFKEGYADVVTVDCAQAAFSALSLDGGSPSVSFDLILLDIHMPDLDGITACKRIKEQDHLRDIPVVMITGAQTPNNLKEAFSAGATDFIKKPPNPIDLLARVGSALMLKRERDRRKEREADLRRSNEELQYALQEVKSLRGLISICSSCKNIRNDSGFWQRLEEYLSEHSEAQFTHGICESCIKKLYPGVHPD